MEDEPDFLVLKEARAYSSHRNYAAALEIYSDVLPTIDQESITYSHVLLEYAQCLLEKIVYETEMSYKRVLQSGRQADQTDVDEDIEICWDSLEVCRVSLEVVNDRKRLCEVHKGLGDVHALNNDFEASAREYLRALEYCDDDDASLELLECVADCYKNRQEYDEAADYYRQIIDQCRKAGDQAKVAEFSALLEGMEFMRHQPIAVEKKKSDEEKEGEAPVNINHLKRK